MTLTLPAKAEFVHIARSVVAGIAAKAAMTLDDIEDVRLAVDEACAHLIANADAAELLTIEIERSSGSLDILASVDAEMAAEPDRGDGSISWRILEALADSVLLERAGGTAAIRLAKRIS